MNKFFYIGKPKDIYDLNVPELLKKVERRMIPILIIDDQDFAYKTILENHGFSLKHVIDIDAIEMISEYEIILCDIKGVGKKFGSKFEGAHLLREIRNKYPFKYIIAYTGQKHDASFNQYFRFADNMVKKDEESEVWIETLDDAINNIASLKEKWLKMRMYMIDRQIPLFKIALLEHEYVSSILSKNIENFSRKQSIQSLPSDVKDVFKSFVGSLIFKIIFTA